MKFLALILLFTGCSTIPETHPFHCEIRDYVGSYGKLKIVAHNLAEALAASEKVRSAFVAEGVMPSDTGSQCGRDD